MLRGFTSRLTGCGLRETKVDVLQDVLTELQKPSSRLKDQLLTHDGVPILKELWGRNLTPNAGKTLKASANSGTVKLQLHHLSLKILDIVMSHDMEKFRTLGVIDKPDEEVERLFDLLKAERAHLNCCVDMAKSWTREQCRAAHQILSNTDLRVFSRDLSGKDSQYGDVWDLVLTNHDGGRLVCDILADAGICAQPHFRSYSPDKRKCDRPLDKCRVSHMISPRYVWVHLQEDWGDLEAVQQKLNSPSYRPIPLRLHYSNSYVIVRLTPSGFTFRALILPGHSALGPEPALVLATDFGWTCTVPKHDIYEAEEILGRQPSYNLACLARLTDVVPNLSNVAQLTIGGLRLLNRIADNVTWVKTCFSRDRITTIISLLHKSQDLEILRHVAYLCAALAPTMSHSLSEPVTAVVGRYLECVDVMRPVMLFYRGAMCKNPTLAQKLIHGPGMELMMRIYSMHQDDPTIKDHFVAIMLEVFHGVELAPTDTSKISSTAAPDEEQQGSVPKGRSTRPDPLEKDGEKYYLPSFDCTYSQLETIGRPSETIAYVQDIASSHYRDEVARELCSLFNHKGGQLIIGVDKEGKMRGKKLGQHERDQIRLEIDDIFTDRDIVQRTYRNYRISSSHLDVQFEDINNTYNTHVQAGATLQLIRVTVDKTGWTGGLVQFNETQNKKDVPREEFDWRFYGRNERGRREISVNEVRQFLAKEMQN